MGLTKLLLILLSFELVLGLDPPTGRMLSLVRQRIDEASATQIFGPLNHQQVSIILDSCEVSDDGAKKLIELSKNFAIITFRLWNSRLSENSLKLLLKSLENQKQMTGITMKSVNLRNVLPQIGKLLTTRLNLVELNIARSNLKDADVAELLKYMLRSNLRRFSLDGNAVTNAGAERIAKLLVATNVASLKLFSNRITNSGVLKLLKTLQKSKVTEISILSSAIKLTKLSQNVADALTDYLTLTQLTLGSHSQALRRSIEPIIKRNQIVLNNAKSAIDLFTRGQLQFTSRFKVELSAFILFSKTEVLWEGIPNRDRLYVVIQDGITRNYQSIFA